MELVCVWEGEGDAGAYTSKVWAIVAKKCGFSRGVADLSQWEQTGSAEACYLLAQEPTVQPIPVGAAWPGSMGSTPARRQRGRRIPGD